MQSVSTKNKYIDLEEAVSLLGVSAATVRNWIRHNYLTPEKTIGKKLVFNHGEVITLRQKIASGEVNRLNKRANKKHSSSTFIPDEYAENQEVVDLVQKIIDAHKTNGLTRNKVILMIALNLLKEKGLINYKKPFSFSQLVFKNEVVKNELNWWLKNIVDSNLNQSYLDFSDINLPAVGDILGLIYQSFVAEGNKAQAGSYYTPKKIVDEIVNDCVKEDYLVLDPCCGTGQFILSASFKTKNPNNVWGFDIDEMAVRIARLNLLLCFPDTDFTPHIYHRNTLLDATAEGLLDELDIPAFDAVITNPPWGVHFSKNEVFELQNLYPSIKSGEAFSYFIQKGLCLLKDGGNLSFVLPEAILNIKTHRDIREVLVGETAIKRIKYLDRLFKNVFTPVIRLDIEKRKPQSGSRVEAEKAGIVNKIEQERLKNNPDYIFNIFTDNTDIEYFDKTYRLKHTTLKDKADWALGVVTGDNKKYLSEEKKDGNEPILTGKDIRKFLTSTPKNFIEFRVERFQQVAPESKYRAKEKLIYKFISKELVFSYDNNQTLTLNSANILIPRIEDYPVKTILALFNSTLYQFLYQKKFGTFKILRGDIEKLPLPIIKRENHKAIEGFVGQLLNRRFSEKERKRIFEELDDYIMKLFDFKDREKEYIKKSVRVSDKLLSLK